MAAGILVEHGFDISGTTANRPVSADVGCRYWDTDIEQLLIWNGTAWVDSSGQVPTAAAGDPGTAAGTGVTAAEAVTGIFKTTLTFDDLVVAMTDAGAAGSHGAQKIYDFPAGNIVILGATTDLDIVAGAGGLAANAAIVAGIGSVTVGTDNGTLTSTEANIVPSTAATLSTGEGAFAGQSTGVTVLDGTATAADTFLNFAVPDAGSSANDTLTVSGTVTLVWLNSGDN